MLLSQNNTVMI